MRHSPVPKILVVVATLAVATVALPGQAAASTRLPPKAAQIRILKKAERRIARKIRAAGSDGALYGDIPLADLRSFNIERLWNEGIDGAGTTVAVVEGWNFRDAQSVLDALDHRYGLPNTRVTTIYPAGRLPKRCPAGMRKMKSYGDCSGWQGELMLDVEAVHLFAPYARIVVSATPADTEKGEDAAEQIAPPEMMKALEIISDRRLANVISISTGSGESTYRRGQAEILAQNPGLLTSAAHGIPVTNATGDCGAGQELANGAGFCKDVTHFRSTSTWDDSPFVTAVGGVTPAYTYNGPGGQDRFSVWNVLIPGLGRASENAGVSDVFPIPSYQDGVEPIIGSPWRAVPDITMDSQDGTSQAAPQFAGVLALATQLKGSDLGPINQVLYEDLGPEGSADGIVNVTMGNNTANGVKGYSAHRGYSIATGWGTVNAAKFVPALAGATDTQPTTGSLQSQAAMQLTQLQSTGTVTPTSAAPTATLSVTSTGFLPALPVQVLVDGKQVTTVTAATDSSLAFSLNLTPLQLTPGSHTITLRGMILTQTIGFQVTG